MKRAQGEKSESSKLGKGGSRNDNGEEIGEKTRISPDGVIVRGSA